MDMVQADLPQIDDLRVCSVASYDVVVHNDHRFALLPAFIAQQQGQLKQPATLVSFDRHHDALEVRRGTEALKGLNVSNLTLAELTDLCRDELSSLDDDWIKAGMELGIVSDAIIFGVEDNLGTESLREYTDSSGVLHTTHIVGLPSEVLAFQGDLSDLAREAELRELWSALGWDPRDGGFHDGATGWWLSIDLDLFIITWRQYLLPWPDEVYEQEFSLEPGYGPVASMNGCALFHEFVKRAGLVTVAREPSHCGGEEKCARVWTDVQTILFGPCN